MYCNVKKNLEWSEHFSKIYFKKEVEKNRYIKYNTRISFTGNDTTSGCGKSTVIERRQQQLGRMADYLPPVTFSVFDL
jgi:hypothetical protein